MKAKPTRQPHRILLALAVCLALQMTGFAMILPLFARRFESLGGGVEALGGSALAYALATTISAPLMGLLADRIGRRPIILLSLSAYVLAFGGYLFAARAWLVILLRGLAGLFTAGLLPAVHSMVGDLGAEDRRARWIGAINGGASLGWILGPSLGGMLYDHFGHVVPSAASVVLESIAFLLALFFVPETRPLSANTAGPYLRRTNAPQALPTMRGFHVLLFTSFGVMFAWAFVEPRFMFYVYDDLGWTSSRLGLIMSSFGLACTLGEFALAQVSDRSGRKPVIVLGMALFSAQFIGLAISRDPRWLMFSFVLAGLGNGLFDPALTAHFLDITPPDQTARIMGLKASAGSLGNVLGPSLLVLLTSRVGPEAIFLMASAFAITLALTALALRAPKGEGVPNPFSHTNAAHGHGIDRPASSGVMKTSTGWADCKTS